MLIPDLDPLIEDIFPVAVNCEQKRENTSLLAVSWTCMQAPLFPPLMIPQPLPWIYHSIQVRSTLFKTHDPPLQGYIKAKRIFDLKFRVLLSMPLRLNSELDRSIVTFSNFLSFCYQSPFTICSSLVNCVCFEVSGTMKIHTFKKMFFKNFETSKQMEWSNDRRLIALKIFLSFYLDKDRNDDSFELKFVILK